MYNNFKHIWPNYLNYTKPKLCRNMYTIIIILKFVRCGIPPDNGAKKNSFNIPVYKVIKMLSI